MAPYVSPTEERAAGRATGGTNTILPVTARQKQRHQKHAIRSAPAHANAQQRLCNLLPAWQCTQRTRQATTRTNALNNDTATRCGTSGRTMSETSRVPKVAVRSRRPPRRNANVADDATNHATTRRDRKLVPHILREKRPRNGQQRIRNQQQYA